MCFQDLDLLLAEISFQSFRCEIITSLNFSTDVQDPKLDVLAQRKSTPVQPSKLQYQFKRSSLCLLHLLELAETTEARYG